MKHLSVLFCLMLCMFGIHAQTLNVLPRLTPGAGTYKDNVKVSCTFPEGCAGGKYWVNGAQIDAKTYDGPITLETTTRLSVAGVNAQGRIITDVVTQEYIISKVTPAYVTTSPEEHTARESFYATTLYWNNATTTSFDASAFKAGGAREKEKFIWLVYEPTQEVIATNTPSQGLWVNGTNTYKVYINKNYRPTAEGAYTLHIASGVFIVDGERYDEELVLHYFVGTDEQTAPVFTPAAGTYDEKVQVSILYPKKAFYQFYQIDGQSRQNYSGPFTITESCTITAWGKTEDYSEDTETATVSYTINAAPKPVDVLPAPVFSRSGNTLSISCAEPGVVIKYWMDNHMQNARVYDAPFSVDHNGVVSAVAYREHGLSPTVNYSVSHFPTNPSDLGLTTWQTPEDWESVYLTSMSPNGRYVSGYSDAGGSPHAFVWDITSGKARYISTQYYSRAMGVSNDGTICGWRVATNTATGETTSTGDDNLFYGYCQGEEWTRQPSGMSVVGITGDNQLMGSYNGMPALYDIKTQQMTVFPGGNGSINCASADNKVFGGYVVKNGKQTPAYWTGETEPIVISTDRECAVVSISASGNWMLLDNEQWGVYYDIAGYRYNAEKNELETITSMGARYPSRYEWLHSVADDGTLYGVYDRTLIMHETGQALAYTPDGVWMDVADMLMERNYVNEELSIVACKLVSSDQNTFVLTVFPAGVDIEDASYSALAVKFDAVLKHAAPTSVEAVQMYGLKKVKLTWEAPISGAEGVVAYKVLRNGELLATTDQNTFIYFDSEVEDRVEYSYTVVAVYDDGKESDPSFASVVTINIMGHAAVRNLTLRQSGINDVNLSWHSPIISLPKLQYFDEKSEYAAFGTSGYDSEWAIRIPASEIAVYGDMNIRTFQFLPTGAQEAYELRLYKGTPGTRNYDSTPYYTQTIDPASLKYGTVNTVEITTPQALPIGNDLLVALFIKQKGNDNMLGISHVGFKAGYTDLCRVDGVHDKFVSIAETSAQTTEIVVPIGVGIANDDMLNSSIVESYEVSDNGVVLGNTSAIRYKIENVEEGEHDFSIRAQYKDGEYSEPTSVTTDLKKNEKAFVPVSDLKVETDEQGAAVFTWAAPLNEDKTLIHWGDLNPTEGFPYDGYPVFSLGSIYPVTMTNAYAGEYEITHMFFYPTADATFRLYLDDNIEEVYYDNIIEGVELNKLNYIPLETPLTVDESVNYRFVIDVDNCPKGVAPVAYDSSNKCENGYSNMLNAGADWMTLDDVLQIDEHPNWLMGLVIRQKNAKEMPLQGYNIVVDGVCKNAQLVKDCRFATSDLTTGDHEVTVDVVYDETRTVKSEPVSFTFHAKETLANKPHYLPGDGVYIVGLPADGSETYQHPVMVTEAYNATFKTTGVELASITADKSYNVSNRLQADGTLDLISFMGCGQASNLIVRNFDGESYTIGDYAPNKTWTKTSLVAAFPAWDGKDSYTLGVYDHWDCPVTCDADAKLTEQKASGLTVDFGNPREGLVCQGVNFNLVSNDAVLKSKISGLAVSIKIMDEKRETVVRTERFNLKSSNVTLLDETEDGNYLYSVYVGIYPQLIIAQPFCVEVDGFDKLSAQAWLPRTVDTHNLYPTHTTYHLASGDETVAETDACINVEGYFNYVGTWGWPNGKEEYGECVAQGDYVQVYIDPSDPDWPGMFFTGDPTFPIECAFGPRDLQIEEKPDWIKEVQMDGSQWNQYGALLIIMQADALPTGESGRYGKVVISTLDEASTYTIHIRQGNASFPTGIGGIKVDVPVSGSMFDLNGRKVSVPLPGHIYIKDGKKVTSNKTR